MAHAVVDDIIDTSKTKTSGPRKMFPMLELILIRPDLL